MERLSNREEQLVAQFHGLLDGIACVEDMFPPDETSGVREPLRPIPPSGFEPAAITLAAVYDLAIARRHYGQLSPVIR